MKVDLYIRRLLERQKADNIVLENLLKALEYIDEAFVRFECSTLDEVKHKAIKRSKEVIESIPTGAEGFDHNEIMHTKIHGHWLSLKL